MTEQEIKFICKQLVEHGDKPLTDTEKELIKQAIDTSKNLNELLTIAFVYSKSKRRTSYCAKRKRRLGCQKKWC